MKVGRNRAGNKYTFTPEDEKDEKFLDRIAELEEENKNLKEELEKKNELLNNVVRCAEQYRGKMISVMEELKMFLYKD